jgi:hypothetical protein
MTRARKLTLLGCFVFVVAVLVTIFVPPLPQDRAYHIYADRHVLWGVSHAGDVFSNIAFTLVGLWGLWLLYVTPAGRALAARTWDVPYAAFLLAVVLVGPCSAFYHQAPSNSTLAWDRFPMTVAFMSLFTALISDRIGERPAHGLLLPLIIAGLASVVYWRMTDDLRPYALVQFLPIPTALIMCALFPPRAGLRGASLVWLLLFYAVAKIAEAGDGVIAAWTGGLVSGHTFKHLFAATACAAVPMFVRAQATPNHASTDVPAS